MGKGDAEVTVGADASAAVRAAAVLKAAYKDAGDSIKSSIGAAASAVITDLSNVALAQGKISFTSQHQQVREFEAATAHFAAAAKQDLESVRAAAESTGAAIGRRPGEVVAWEQSVARLTYNFQGAEKSIKGFAGLAAETGRTVEDYKGLAIVIGSVGAVSGDSTKALGTMVAQAELLNTKGGVAAFADQVEQLGDILSRTAVRSEADLARITAAGATLGKELNPQAAARVQQKVLSFAEGNIIAHERYLGHSITDKQGHVQDPMAVMLELRNKVKKQYGAGRERNMLAMMMGGDVEAASALMNFDDKTYKAAIGAKPSSALPESLQKYLGTDAGKRDVAQAELAKSSRDLLGSSTKLGRAADSLQQFAAKNPISSTLISTAMGGAISNFMATFGKSLATMMGGKGAGGAVGGAIDIATKGTGAAGFLGKAGMVGMALGTGIVIGTAADEAFGISDYISGTGTHSRAKSDADAADVAADRALKEKVARIRHANEMGRGARSSLDLAASLGLVKIPGQEAGKPEDAKALHEQQGQIIGKFVADAIKAGMAEMKLQTAPDTPPVVIRSAGKSKSAGHQG